MTTEPSGDEFDRLERTLGAELDLTTRLIQMGIQGGNLGHVQGSLGVLTAMRAEAGRLAANGRPAVSERLGGMIDDVAVAMKTMGATDAMLRKADLVDTEAEKRARGERAGVWKQTLDEKAEAAQKRANASGKLL